MRSLLKSLSASLTPPPTTFVTMTALPPGFTYSRPDTVATYRDSSGIMRMATANAPRFNYNSSGTALGLRLEGQRINLFTGYNMLPTVTTGFSTTGTATIGLSTDAAALAGDKIDSVCTGNVYVASGGASGGTVLLPGTTGSTSNCSFSTWARISAGSSATLTNSGTSPGSVTISGSAYARYKLENQIISATTVQMVLNVPASTMVMFILCQMEVGGFASSVIKTAGATATRFNDSLIDTSIMTRSYFNLKQGAIIVDLTYDNINTSSNTAPFFLGAGGQNFTYCIGAATIAGTTRRKMLSRYYVNSVQQYSPDIGSLDEINQRYSFGTSWIDNVKATASSGAGTYQTFTVGSLIGNGIDRLYLGGRSTTDYIFGHILAIKFYKTYRTPAQLGRDLVKSGDWVVHSCGQSNMTDWFSAQTGSNNSGEIAGKANLDAAWPTTRNWITNGGTEGTSVIYYPGTSTTTNWWYDPSTGNLGTPFLRWMDIAQGALNGSAQALLDTSGESDAGSCTQQQFVDAQTAKHGIMYSVIGNVPVFLAPIGGNSSPLDSYQVIRQAQWQYAAANPTKVFLCPERFDLARSDSIHMSDASAGIYANRMTRKMLKVLGYMVSGGVDGPSVTGVTRSGTTVTVTITHDGGTDFSPTSAISGFEYFNGADYTATQNTITAAVRSNATTITLTLTSASAGTLYYGKGSLSTQTQANLVIDNSAQAMPLRAAMFIVA